MAGKRGGAKPKLVLNPRRIELLAAKGLNEKQVAAAMGVSYSTLNRRKKDQKIIRDAMERGKAQGAKMVAEALMRNIKLGDTKAQMFYLERRAGWVREQVIETTIKEEKLPDEEKAILERFRSERSA